MFEKPSRSYKNGELAAVIPKNDFYLNGSTKYAVEETLSQSRKSNFQGWGEIVVGLKFGNNIGFG